MTLLDDLSKLSTEAQNQNTLNIDTMSTLEIVKVINNEDHKVAMAVQKEIPNIVLAVDKIVECLNNNGRLIYCGAGTSGRLGVLDASECPPTYGVDYNTVLGLIAGGKEALLVAKEGAEDSLTLCQSDLQGINFNQNDVLVGIAASGRTPYVIGGFMYAKEIKAATISISCNGESQMAKMADIAISPNVGPEVVTGSTRMKSGTAQKMILNILSTTAMIKLGKVYKNLMVDVKASNEKLFNRAIKIVIDATGVEYERAKELLVLANNKVKVAIYMELTGYDANESSNRLDSVGGHLSRALLIK